MATVRMHLIPSGSYVQEGFLSWLLTQQERDDPVGDLAGDYAHEVEHGRGGITFVDNKPALWGCDGAQEALEQAWQEWSSVPNEP